MERVHVLLSCLMDGKAVGSFCLAYSELLVCVLERGRTARAVFVRLLKG